MDKTTETETDCGIARAAKQTWPEKFPPDPLAPPATPEATIREAIAKLTVYLDEIKVADAPHWAGFLYSRQCDMGQALEQLSGRLWLPNSVAMFVRTLLAQTDAKVLESKTEMELRLLLSGLNSVATALLQRNEQP